MSAGPQPATRPRAVVLLSGGLDSATVAAIARSDGFDVVALTFDYGQRHRSELFAAEQVARAAGAVRHVVMPINLRVFGGSALTADIPVPKGRSGDEIGEGIPVTYVPARNTIFLSFALGLAEVERCADIFIGVNARDYSGYPDCRPAFIAAFERMANLAIAEAVEGRLSIRIRAPLMEMGKGEIIRTGLALGVDYGLTRSCYDPDTHGRACGRCDSCQLRLKGFAEAGIPDPAPYMP
ncbi:MAG TPA: 7-cyano-7-deazaguanine synthase QueC [Alphaproteobacteria bacterium]|jgi:7-cyano-7-deazaguanine synthase|nr:7-cyano-7-deazaguanine synthase QueC [Alphaproteobacteria bacterium]